MKLRTLLCGILVVLAAPLGAGSPERLSMRVSPSVAFAPADLSVRTTIEANEQNRTIEIIAESADFYRSSQTPLDGEKAPRTTQFEFRSLPGGAYTVTAVLKGAGDEPLAQTRREINVVEGGSAR
jgi:hypothetical protein